ncbi:sensor histidine kinase [Sporomusa acidovorans]|uniref:histidine kinase n=1 Tax=Sporomusa acidovorans (strain ATCC 49682 / DSM 3132 / Mol) TaxID=1123286 RepID=A0ABZ3J5U0_SPOA4|nr:HAMP domain-containing sensor histidine kinase [Sporomusa acidovorans]OZC21012.1 sensor protein kinase WalK [Sporomusa acidovorans DSM 3132]SDF18429.1 Signal transduction histidine kinase [Sporomusa acidovorans]
MLIRHRLILSNLIMFIIPFVVILFVAGGAYLIFTESNRYAFNNPDEDKKKVHLVEYDIREYSYAMLNAESEELFSYLQKELQEKILLKGYHLLIMCDGQYVLSNLTDDDWYALGEEKSPVVFSENSAVMILRASNIVKYMFQKDEKQFHLIAIQTRDVSSIEKKLNYFFRSYLCCVILVGLFIIWFVNMMLSSSLAKKINKPLELLRQGAREIKNGNLDFDIKYAGNDEFSQVCGDFDEMRKRLKYSEEVQAKYEDDRKILIAGISHDIRTPLTVIKGYIEGLRDGVANTEEKRKRYIDMIYNRACDMDILVDKLFLFSKLNMGNFPFNFKILDFAAYIAEFYHRVKNEFAEKGVDISYYQLCRNHLKVKIDSEEFKRVLMNIIDNCFKHRVRDRVDVKMILFLEDNEVVLKISDDGGGVSESEINQVFTSFYRGDPARSNSCEGSGLGLAISQQIILAHGGSIYAVNDNGFHIFIKLPLA